MADTHETIADIIAHKRQQAAYIVQTAQGKRNACRDKAEDEARDIRREADRLEAAYKREKAAIEADALAVGGLVEAAHGRELSKNASKNGADFGQLGDCAKLRDAMIEVLEYIESFHKYITPGGNKKLTALFAVADTIRDKARAALADPPRNCEVGTAMEQGERFSAYCRAHKHPESECLPCPLFGQTGGHCELAWAQMPYEEGGAKCK